MFLVGSVAFWLGPGGGLVGFWVKASWALVGPKFLTPVGSGCAVDVSWLDSGLVVVGLWLSPVGTWLGLEWVRLVLVGCTCGPGSGWAEAIGRPRAL